MCDSDHTAVGQALGYVYQFDRATYPLLQADNNVVSFAAEHVDDVSVHRSDGSAVQEQDETAITASRPLPDRSVALWKTLAIWADQVKGDPAVVVSTEFHINGEVAVESLAARIHAASGQEECESVAEELLTASLSLREELQPFGGAVKALGPQLPAQLVSRISVLDTLPRATAATWINCLR